MGTRVTRQGGVDGRVEGRGEPWPPLLMFAHDHTCTCSHSHSPTGMDCSTPSTPDSVQSSMSLSVWKRTVVHHTHYQHGRVGPHTIRVKVHVCMCVHVLFSAFHHLQFRKWYSCMQVKIAGKPGNEAKRCCLFASHRSTYM